jgi:nitroreductase/dihydropteridine reductase
MELTQDSILQTDIPNIQGKHLIQALNWRYATKCMNGKIVPHDKLDRILEAIRLSASSFGLQPYTIIVIENRNLLEKVKSAANNQPQVTEASHLLVFAAWENLMQKKIDDFITQVAKERGVAEESLQEVKAKMESQLAFPSEKNVEWAARQAYIALGTGLIAAAVESVDATPMDGFNSSAMDAILGLKEKGLKSVVLMALGYRDAEKDPLVNAKKIRRDKDALYIKM